MKKITNGKSKKMLAGILALSLAVPSTVWAGTSLIRENRASADAMFQLGDVNEDGEVKINDAQLALKIALNLRTFTEAEKKAADANKSGKVEVLDAQKILKWALNLEPVPSPEPIVSEEPGASSEPLESETPLESEPPGESSEPSESKNPPAPPVPSASSSQPAPSKTSVPVGASLEPVSPAAYVVPADKAVLVATNGAVEEDGIFTYTSVNETNAKGIQFLWPYIDRMDLVEDLTQAGVSMEDLSTIPKEKLLKPAKPADKEAWDFKYEYPRPKWHTGISVSFWSKEKWDMEEQSNSGALMVLKRTKYCDENPGSALGGAQNAHGSKGDCDYALVVRSSGRVTFLAGDEAKNTFCTTNITMGSDNEWNHYTITITNDWIQIYVNGQEMAYVGVDMDNAVCSKFNKGFMTKYNPAGLVNQDIVDKDVRKYLISTGPSGKDGVWRKTAGGYDTNWEATLIGNSRYESSKSAIEGFDKYSTLMELLTLEGTEFWLGGVKTCCATNECKYDTPAGTQVADVQCYSRELKADEVAAVYKDSLDRCKSKLGLD